MKKDNDKNMILMHIASLVAKFSLCEIELFCLCAGTPELRASALYISTDFFKAFFAFITKHLFS